MDNDQQPTDEEIEIQAEADDNELSDRDLEKVAGGGSSNSGPKMKPL